MCRNVGIEFLSWKCVDTTIKCLGKHVSHTNPCKFHDRLFSDICADYVSTRKRNTGFYVLRLGVPEGHSSGEGYASFK